MSLIVLFWWLVLAHFVADYPLQSDFIARFKSRKSSLPAVPWYYVMAGHAATHAAAVGLLTQSGLLSVLEFVAHFAIDVAKCEEMTNIHVDQCLHIACKAVWVVLVFYGAR